MSIATTLKDAPIGARCMVCSIDEQLAVKNRLIEMGFFSGSYVDKLYTGPFGSPIAFRVGGAIIAVRSDDADKITAKI